MAIEALEKEMADLSEENLQKVFEYIQFLKFDWSVVGQKEAEKGNRRTPGGLKGPLRMSEDFDETPECFQEYL